MTSKTTKKNKSSPLSKKTKRLRNLSIKGFKWDAVYKNNNANINLDLINNGKIKHYKMKFNNNDDELKSLQNDILNYNMINIPLEDRLLNDFNLHPIMSLSNIKIKNTKKNKKIRTIKK